MSKRTGGAAETQAGSAASTKSAEKTLLASVLLSAPGPLVMGLGLLLGRSSTQLADFVRRTAELVAIIVSWLVYRITHRSGDGDRDDARAEAADARTSAEAADHKAKLERLANTAVGIAMCIGGLAMLAVAFRTTDGEKGNVIPALVIAVLGVTVNAWFWLRYRKLDRAHPNAIVAVQSNLYRTKTIVDTCVTAALATVAIAPASAAAAYMDIAGTIVVAIYLIGNGAVTAFKAA